MNDLEPPATPTISREQRASSGYAPSDHDCDECGAGAGEPCLPLCTAPHGPGGPYEHDDPADDAQGCDTPEA